MTKDPIIYLISQQALHIAATSTWRKHQVQRRWHSLLSVFITTCLVLAIFSGFSKSLTLKQIFGHSDWDGRSPFISVLAISPPSVLILQTDTKRIFILTFPSDTYLPTGRQTKPLVAAGDLNTNDGPELSRILSLTFQTNIKNYIILDQKLKADENTAQKLFKNFASITTPFFILTGKITSVANTNITRQDLFRLWWQVKDISVKNLVTVNLAPLREEVITAKDTKILGVDEQSVNQKISGYLENPELSQSDYKIILQNASGTSSALALADEFITSVGLTVIKTESTSSTSAKTIIIGDKNSPAFANLVKIFNCDITSCLERGQTDQDKKTITVIIGQFFANKYFQ